VWFASEVVVSETNTRDRLKNEDLLRFESLLADLSARFINLPAEQVDDAIVDAQRRTCEFAGEERLSLATEAADAGPWVLDAKGKRFWVGPKIMELFGLPSSDALDVERFIELIHSDDRRGVCDALAEVIQSGEMKVVEYRIVRPDGQVRWMQSRGRLFGKPERARLMGVTSDITERREMDKALRESEARIAAALDVAALGSYEVLNGLRVSFADRRTREIIGLPEADEKAGRILEFWLEHIHPEDVPHIMEVSQAMEVDGLVDRMTADYRFLHPQRGVIHIHHLACVMERDAAGRAVRTIGVMQDVTERRQMELDAIELRHELTRISRVSAMGELVASLAHELNQPLTAILANAQAAQRLLTSSRPDLGEIREILADIATDDQRAGEVISRVRSLLKKGAMERKRLDMNDVIREVLGLLRTNALLKGVSVASELTPGVLPVLGDRIQLQQVLMNLVLNAFDAMQRGSAGGRELNVSSQMSEGAGALVAVRDSGRGIPPAIMPRIFEPFFTSKADGMGMGLSICRTIIESHGGRIWAENNPDGGAVFQFELPVAEGEQAISNQ